MLTTLIFSLTLGAISSVNPCGFALLPAYFAHRLGVNTTSELDRGLALGLALNAGGAATAGFVVVFGVIGAVISFGAYWLGDILPWAGFAIGILLVNIGVLVILGKHIGVKLPKFSSLTKQHGLKGDFLFGVGYGTASLSCTLPIFLSVTGVAISGGLLGSFLNFVAFGIGMGTVLIAIAVAASASFLSPIVYQTNTMVYGPGGYRFFDYARLGAPLTIIVILTTVILEPAFW